MSALVFAIAAGQGSELYSSSLSPEFQAWCTKGTALVQEATARYAEQKADSAAGLQNATQALGAAEAELAAVAAVGRPQSTGPNAGFEAAMKAMELAFTPEVAELHDAERRFQVLVASYRADYDDGSVLSQNGQLLLGQFAKAQRQEKDLGGEVELALRPAVGPLGFLSRGTVVRRAVSFGEAVATVSAVGASSPLQILRRMQESLEARKDECAAHLAARDALTAQHAAAESARGDATAKAVKRIDETSAVLKEFTSYQEALQATEEAGMALLTRERTLYAEEVERVAELKDAEAMKVLDAAHGFWVEWGAGLHASFHRLVEYLGTRQQLLRARLASQEYLRPDRSPHLEWTKTSPHPEGLYCPDEQEYARRRGLVEDAIAELGKLD